MEAVLNISEKVLQQNEAGVWLIDGTRVSLDSVIYAFNEGASAEEIILRFPTLKLPQVYTVISYYLKNSKEVDEYLQERELKREKLREKIEAKHSPKGIRERLLSRQSK